VAEGDELLSRYQTAVAARYRTDATAEKLEVYRVEAEMMMYAVTLEPLALREFLKQKNQIEQRRGAAWKD
jgi:hypothetical protein